MITIVGIGPGDSSYYLLQASIQAMAEANYIIGSERQLEIVPESVSASKLILPKPLANLKQFLVDNIEEKIVLLASGDPLMYGIANWALKNFESKDIVIIPGISSIHYLFNRVQLPMEDCFLTSSHGKIPNFDLLYQLPKVALVTDTKWGPFELAQEMVRRGGKKQFIIGEKLSYPDEVIQKYSCETVPKREYNMNVVVILDER